MKLLNFFGLYTKQQYKELEEIFLRRIEEVKKERDQSLKTILEMQHEIKILPFEFDKLINNYSKGQLNALFYKLVNFCRNKKEYRDLCKTWDKRVQNANDSIPEK